MPDVTRRRYLRAAAGTATVGVVGAASLAGLSAGAHEDALPEHVSLTFPRAAMERYRPLLDIPDSAAFQSPVLYGWKASSPEHDLDAYVYFAYYRGQRGWTLSDSHRGDREPFYALVDPQYDEVRQVIYSGWHWMAARSDNPNIYQGGPDGHHPTAVTFPTHHHYALQDHAGGSLFDVERLGTDSEAPFVADASSDVKFEEWLADGWEEALHPGAAQNPWLMTERDAWWRDGTERYARLVWNIQLQIASIGFLPDSFVGAASTSDLA